MNFSLVATFFGGLLSGIFFRSFVDLGWSFAVLLILLSIVTWELSSQVVRGGGFVAIFLLALALGIFRYDLADTKDRTAELKKFENQTIKVEGVVADEPREKDKTTILTVRTSLGGQSFNALILTKPYFKYNYGDELIVYGELTKVKNFAGDFDYVAYLAKDEIYYQFLNPRIILQGKLEIVSDRSQPRGKFASDTISSLPSHIQEKLFDLKNSFLEKLNLVLPEPESSLMGGIILGARSSMDKSLTEKFKKVGLIHIVALSGYNLTVVADFLMKIMKFMPLAIRLAAGSLWVIFFAMLTGGGSTVVRASIMVLLAALARATGRIYLAGMALFTAATIMILYDPKIFVFDLSFQLSFLATAGLIFLTPPLEKKLEFVTDKFNLRGAIVSTLAAQLAVWPFILYKMGTFSLVSIPANILVAPFIPYIMGWGVTTGLVGFVSYYLSLIPAYVSYFLLFYTIKVTEFFASLPLASMDGLYFPVSLTIIIYVVYLTWVFRGDTLK